MRKGYDDKPNYVRAFFVGLGSTIGTFLMLFLGTLIATAFGALGGYVAGLFFAETLTILAGYAGFTAPYQLGAAIAFLLSFLRR